MKTHRDLVIRAKELYPTSRYMRKQWVRWTFILYASGKHRLSTAGEFNHAG